MGDSGDRGPQRAESPEERHDRELIELLNELRVALPGVVLLIAPSAYHRIGWRAEDKGRIVEASNKLAIAGLFFLAVSIEAVVLLVTDYIFDQTRAIATAAAIGALFVVFWCVLPLVGRARS